MDRDACRDVNSPPFKVGDKVVNDPREPLSAIEGKTVTVRAVAWNAPYRRWKALVEVPGYGELEYWAWYFLPVPASISPADARDVLAIFECIRAYVCDPECEARIKRLEPILRQVGEQGP